MKHSSWAHELTDSLWGRPLSKTDLLNYLILSNAPVLSDKQVAELKAQTHDPVRAIEWAAHKAKEAALRGKEIYLKNIIQSVSRPDVKPKKLVAKLF